MNGPACCPKKEGMACEIAVNASTSVLCHYIKTQRSSGYWELMKPCKESGPKLSVTVEPPYRSTHPEIFPSMDEWSVTRWRKPKDSNELNRPVMWIARDRDFALGMALDIVMGSEPKGGIRLRSSLTLDDIEPPCRTEVPMKEEEFDKCPECGSILDVDGTVMEGPGCWYCLGVNEDDCE